MKNFLQNGGDMATQTIERPAELTEQKLNQRVLLPQTKFTTLHSELEPKNRTVGKIARMRVAFNDWRHRDLFDIIFNDFFFENRSRALAAASLEN